MTIASCRMAACACRASTTSPPGCLKASPSADRRRWTQRRLIQSRIATGAREDIKLPQSVPVIWVYMTGWASADGTVHFRDDVYNVDTVGG